MRERVRVKESMRERDRESGEHRVQQHNTRASNVVYSRRGGRWAGERHLKRKVGRGAGGTRRRACDISNARGHREKKKRTLKSPSNPIDRGDLESKVVRARAGRRACVQPTRQSYLS